MQEVVQTALVNVSMEDIEQARVNTYFSSAINSFHCLHEIYLL